ncbi:polyol transporter 5-like [Pyrus x bretschneideri]|uniref:polyol transporter 5-like n=1 Tax=Pyrus x bretschneideri TaxID=225117 RepID=UPI00202F82EF|nr:polyol transporter 5-like [Pyrus x bretschneideri]
MEMADQRAENNVVSGQPQNSIADFDPPKKPKTKKFAVACAVLASMTSILLGYDIGVMSGASLFIKENLNISDVQVEVLNGTLNIYSLIGSALAGKTSDWIGRRYTIVLAGTIFFIGALLMGFAPNYAFLMFGRFIAGVGVGYALMIAPVYTAEISPASFRGFLTSFPEVFVNVGILLGYVSNFALAKLPIHLNWRIMLGIGAIPSVFLALGVLAMPESPRWLVMQGRLGDAKRVLNRTSSSEEESQLRLDEIKEAAGIPKDSKDEVVQVSKRSQGEGIWQELLIRPTPAVRHILIAALGIHFFQQVSGTDSVVLYSPRIFEKAGITSYNDKLLATVAVGFVKTIAILVATFQVDRFGRRALLLSSVGGMVVSFTLLGVGLTVVDQSHSNRRAMLNQCLVLILVRWPIPLLLQLSSAREKYLGKILQIKKTQRSVQAQKEENAQRMRIIYDDMRGLNTMTNVELMHDIRVLVRINCFTKRASWNNLPEDLKKSMLDELSDALPAVVA